MSSSQAFTYRLAVGTPDGPNSATVRIWCDGVSSDVYVAMRELAGDVKVSLHESGECHSGFTLESAERNKALMSQLGGSRHQHVWRRRTMLGSQSAAALHVCFPHSELRIWRDQRPEMNIRWLPAPSCEHSVSVHCVYSGSKRSDDEWPGRPRGLSLIGAHRLPNGEKLWVLSEYHRTSPVELKVLAAASGAKPGGMLQFNPSQLAKRAGHRVTGFALDVESGAAFMVDVAGDRRPAAL